MQETSFSPPKSHSEGLEAAAAWLTPPPPSALLVDNHCFGRTLGQFSKSPELP